MLANLCSKIFAVCLGLLLGLLCAEGALRVLRVSVGRSPVAANTQAEIRTLPPYRLSGGVGWELAPGNYRLESKEITVWPDGGRATRPGFHGTSEPNLPAIIFIGDSFTFGEGLNDNETLPWRVQERMPEFNVSNYAVGGYGTCQTLLRFRRSDTDLRGGYVIYGFSAFHEQRNTADPRQDYWIAVGSPKRTSFYPRCRLEAQELVVEPPKSWSVLIPFTGKLVVSNVVTGVVLSALSRQRALEKQAVTEKLLLELQRESASRGGTFVVLLQDLAGKDLVSYKEYLLQRQIAFIDGTGAAGRPELRLEDDHPGPQLTTIWAQAVAGFLRKPANLSQASQATLNDR